jgi:hypothetical protein
MDKFEEFKFFAQMTQDLSQRRQNATQTFLTVNTVIFTVLAFLVKDAGFRGWGLVAITIPLFMVGIIACLVWLRIIGDYQRIIGWRYEELRSMEAALPGAYGMFQREWQRYYEPKDTRERMGSSSLEARLPRLFITLYLLYGLGIAIGAAAGWL